MIPVQWLSRDPLNMAEMSQGPNLYEYVRNNPVNMVDPIGLWQLTVEGGALFGGQLTVGNNGGTGAFNGQWSVGLHLGFGEGLAVSLDPKNSGCKPKGFSDTGVVMDGTAKLGTGGIAITDNITGAGNSLDLGLDTGAAHTTVPLTSGGQPSTSSPPTFGGGEGATLSGGSTYNF